MRWSLVISAGHCLYTASRGIGAKRQFERRTPLYFPGLIKNLIITLIFQLSIEDQCDLDDIYSFNRWEDSDLERI